MDDDLKGLLKMVGGVFAVLAVFIAIGAVLSVGFNKAACDRYRRLSPDYNWNFSFYGGCLVQTHSGRWISPDNFYQLEQLP